MALKKRDNIISLQAKSGGSRADILEMVKNRVEDKTDYLMSGLCLNIQNALFEEMTGISEEEKLARHFNIMRSVKQGELQFRSRFRQLDARLWETLPRGMDESHIPRPSGDVVEIIDKFAQRTANHYKVLIQETSYRLQTICKRVIDRHPLNPDLYYRAFWHAIAGLALSYEERCLVMMLFHRFVMDRYGQILAMANQTLIDFKVETTVQLPTSSQ